MANKRVKDLTTDTSLSAGDYVLLDSASEGTRKFDLGTEIGDLKSELEQLSGLSPDIKAALIQLAQKVSYLDPADGPNCYQDLYDALYPAPELSSISAVYTQTETVFEDTSLDDLKNDLVVTAHYSDSSEETLESTDYTLSGTLAEGTSTVTVTYEEKTTTFNVTVSDNLIHSWDFTQGLTDSVGGVTATLNNCTRASDGVTFDDTTDNIVLGNVFGFNKTLEIDYTDALISVPSKKNGIWFWTDSNITCGFGYHYSSTSANNKFGYYSSDVGSWIYASSYGKTSFDGSGTIRLTVDAEGKVHVYKDGTEVNLATVPYYNTESKVSYLTIGSSNGDYPCFYNAKITKARIYHGVISDV